MRAMHPARWACASTSAHAPRFGCTPQTIEQLGACSCALMALAQPNACLLLGICRPLLLVWAKGVVVVLCVGKGGLDLGGQGPCVGKRRVGKRRLCGQKAFLAISLYQFAQRPTPIPAALLAFTPTHAFAGNGLPALPVGRALVAPKRMLVPSERTAALINCNVCPCCCLSICC